MQAAVTSTTAAYEVVMKILDEERASLEGLISLLERNPDLANKLAVVLKLALERR